MESRVATLAGPDVGLDFRGAQPLDRPQQLDIVLAAGAAGDALQQLIGRRVDDRPQVVLAGVALGHDPGNTPDQDIGIPDRRHAVGRVAVDLDPQLAVRGLIVDRLIALALGDGEERPLHHLRAVLRRVVDQVGDEEIPDRVWVGAGAHAPSPSLPAFGRPAIIARPSGACRPGAGQDPAPRQ